VLQYIQYLVVLFLGDEVAKSIEIGSPENVPVRSILEPAET